MKDPPTDTDDDLAALNQLYNLSAGMKVPAQVPVAMAMEIIVNEANPKTTKLNEVITAIENNRTKFETKLFEYIVDNKKIAVSSLINSDKWKMSENTFIDFLTLNVNQNGFNGRIFNLSDSDRNLLFNYLKQII
jgi:UDP-N-acetyl-D-mannosaminuronate dehydrogenase